MYKMMNDNDENNREEVNKVDEVKQIKEEPMTLVELAKEVKEPTCEQMDRETPKKCCTVSQQAKCACNCCLKTWSCSLNTVEGCCTVTSMACIFMSTLAIGCNKFLEYIDCDGH
jgi:hypothetical protein